MIRFVLLVGLLGSWTGSVWGWEEMADVESARVVGGCPCLVIVTSSCATAQIPFLPPAPCTECTGQTASHWSIATGCLEGGSCSPPSCSQYPFCCITLTWIWDTDCRDWDDAGSWVCNGTSYAHLPRCGNVNHDEEDPLDSGDGWVGSTLSHVDPNCGKKYDWYCDDVATVYTYGEVWDMIPLLSLPLCAARVTTYYAGICPACLQPPVAPPPGPFCETEYRESGYTCSFADQHTRSVVGHPECSVYEDPTP